VEIFFRTQLARNNICNIGVIMFHISLPAACDWMSAGDVTTSRGQSSAPATQPNGVGDVTDSSSISVSGRAATPARCRVEPRDHDDDVTTTTSGSYSVDRAQELCSEIDQMYFTPGSTNV